MPCTFSGIFFIRNVNGHILHCTFKDEYEDERNLTITYFDNEMNRVGPHPTAFQEIHEGNVYFLSGTFYIDNDDFANPKVQHIFTPVYLM
jgi:hypothetical protein